VIFEDCIGIDYQIWFIRITRTFSNPDEINNLQQMADVRVREALRIKGWIIPILKESIWRLKAGKEIGRVKQTP